MHIALTAWVTLFMPLWFQEKAGAPDQFSHHLTRPPPDYEQARIAVGGQPSMIYTGRMTHSGRKYLIDVIVFCVHSTSQYSFH